MTITLKDRLSHLTYREARKLLGPEGESLWSNLHTLAFFIRRS